MLEGGFFKCRQGQHQVSMWASIMVFGPGQELAGDSVCVTSMCSARLTLVTLLVGKLFNMND